MIHMLSNFDLKSGKDFTLFMRDDEPLLADRRAADITADAGRLGSPVEETPIDADADSTQRYFSIMNFRDRAQLDASCAHVGARTGTATHIKIHRRLTNTAFLCREGTALKRTRP